MSLRTKTIGILLLVSICTAAALYYFSSKTLTAEYSFLEQQENIDKINRVRLALNNEVAEFSSRTSLLAEWPEFRALLESGDATHIQTPRIYESLSGLSISNLLLRNTAGEIVAWFKVESENKNLTSLYDSGLEDPVASLIISTKSPKATIGTLGNSDSVHIIAAAPIITADLVSPIEGTLIAAIELNNSFTNRLAELTQTQLSVFSLDQWAKYSVAHGLKTPQMSETTFYSPDSESISGFISVQDTYGKNVAIVKVNGARRITKSGEHVNSILALSLLGALAAGILASWLLLQISVLNPLAKLQTEVRRINYRKLNGARVTAKGSDELSQLGTDLNILLSALEQTHQDLEAAKASSEAANESKSIFFSALSHDIKNTVGAIKGWLEIGLRKSSGPDFRRCMANAYQATSGLISNISGLLDYERAERGALKIDECDFSLEALLQDLRVTVSSLLKGSRVIFGIRVPADAPKIFVADPVRLQRILTTILSNSAKFTKHGRITLTLLFQRNGDAHRGLIPGELSFRISDTGLALSESELSSLFELKTNGSSIDSRKDTTTSFGLFVCRSLIEGMGGKLAVSSTLGEGTVFNFSIHCSAKSYPEKIQVTDNFVAVITRLANECPVYQSVSEFCQNTRAFTSLDELGKPNDFTATIIVSQVGEALGHSQFLNDHKEKIILCIDSRNDHDLLEFNGRGFRGLIHGPALTSELISTLNSSRASEQLAQPAMELITPTSRPCKILYVDDSEINRIAPGELLKDAGYDVSFASDGEELLGIIETQLTNGKSDFDLIITDIFMPRMDGTIAAQNIRALEKRLGRKDRLPIIAVTGYSSDQERTQIMSYGINDVIDKPVNPRELSNVLARVLGYPSPK